jgi:hypothetical protein
MSKMGNYVLEEEEAGRLEFNGSEYVKTENTWDLYDQLELAEKTENTWDLYDQLELAEFELQSAFTHWQNIKDRINK